MKSGQRDVKNHLTSSKQVFRQFKRIKTLALTPVPNIYTQRCPHYATSCHVIPGDNASLHPPSRQQQSATYVKTRHPKKALAISNQSPSDRGNICSQTGAALYSREPEPFHAGMTKWLGLSFTNKHTFLSSNSNHRKDFLNIFTQMWNKRWLKSLKLQCKQTTSRFYYRGEEIACGSRYLHANKLLRHYLPRREQNIITRLLLRVAPLINDRLPHPEHKLTQTLVNVQMFFFPPSTFRAALDA